MISERVCGNIVRLLSGTLFRVNRDTIRFGEFKSKDRIGKELLRWLRVHIVVKKQPLVAIGHGQRKPLDGLSVLICRPSAWWKTDGWFVKCCVQNASAPWWNLLEITNIPVVLSMRSRWSVVFFVINVFRSITRRKFSAVKISWHRISLVDMNIIYSRIHIGGLRA